MPQKDAARTTGATGHRARPSPDAGTAAGTGTVPDGVPDTAPGPGSPAGAVPPDAPDPAAARPAATGVQDASPAPRLDARAAARADLAAGRSPSLWWVCTGIVAVLAVTATLGAPQGALALACLLAVSAVARAVLRRGPVALTVRSRALDSAVLAGLALGVGLLSQLVPMP